MTDRSQYLRERRDAYVAVFGVEGSRTVHQEAVLKDLERFTHYGDTAIHKDQSGRYDGGMTAYKTGLQDVIKRIYLRINWRETDDSSRTDSESAE